MQFSNKRSSLAHFGYTQQLLMNNLAYNYTSFPMKHKVELTHIFQAVDVSKEIMSEWKQCRILSQRALRCQNNLCSNEPQSWYVLPLQNYSF